MKQFRRAGIFIALILLVVSLGIRANLNVLNPTGLRYSSEYPLRTGEGTAQEIGTDGERVLAIDLNVINNNRAGQIQCACNTPNYDQSPPTQCNICFGFSENIENYRIPDFVTLNYIAESKNVASLQAFRQNGEEIRDYQQIRDIVDVALLLDLPFWVYVRVDTEVAPEYLDLVEATGGGIVYYFAYDGYIDPAEQFANSVMPIAVIVLVLLGAWELRGGKSRNTVTVPLNPSTPKAKPPKEPLGKSTSSVNNAEDFQSKLRNKLDIDSIRHDD